MKGRKGKERKGKELIKCQETEHVAICVIAKCKLNQMVPKRRFCGGCQGCETYFNRTTRTYRSRWILSNKRRYTGDYQGIHDSTMLYSFSNTCVSSLLPPVQTVIRGLYHTRNEITSDSREVQTFSQQAIRRLTSNRSLRTMKIDTTSD
jgi:hypothetical protein